jgi:DNA gyrase subunit A
MPIINLEGVQVESGERVLATVTLPHFETGHNLVLATVKGIIKKTPIEKFERVRATGIRALTVADDDKLAWVAVSSGEDDIIIATAMGRIARFHEEEVRPMGRDAAGVIGIRLANKADRVVNMGVLREDMDILVLTETGYGKRVANSEFRNKHRGGQGVRLISLEGAKSGAVAAVKLVDESDEELLLISREGQVVRTDVGTINRYGSAARGVIVMRLNEGDSVAGIAVFREGLAGQHGVGENGDEGPHEDGPGSDGAAQA